MTRIEAGRWWALAGLMLAVLTVGLDGTVLSVALPTLAIALHATESDLQWFSSAYLLVLAAAMLPAGLLGDRYGRKKVIVGALTVFGAGSMACAYAPSPGAFIAARAALGLAGAAIIVMALSTITVLFSEDERPRAVGVWASANFLALPIGPLLGGWLLTHYWWGWVFLINVPVALLGLVAALVLVPESRAARRPGLDAAGVLTSTAGLVGVTYGLIEAGRNGWGSAGALTPIVVGLLLLIGFLLWESRLSRRPGGQPVVDPALFGSAPFTWGVLLASTVGLAMVGVIFTMPQYFQGVLGTDAMGSGLRLLPLIAGLVVGALPADRVARLVGAKACVAVGFAMLAAALLAGALTTRVESSDWFIAGWLTLAGAGMGLTLATASSSALSQLSPQQSGVGAAVMQALQKVGAPFGAAIVGSVLSAGYQGSVNVTGLPSAAAGAVRASVFSGLAVAHQVHSAPLLESVRAAFVHGLDVALIASAGIAAVGMVLALAFLPGTASTRAEGFEPVEKEAAFAVRK